MSGMSAPPVPLKFDSAGNVLANINAQNITPNAVATNVKTDASGNVLANINAQNINPNAVATNIKTDSAGNVLANINAQNINPTIANPYAPQLLSHQTGLSASISTSNAWVNTGTSITVPRNGIVKIILMGYLSGSGTLGAYWRFTLTRGSTTYVVRDEQGNTSFNTSSQTSSTFVSRYRYSNYGNSILVLELLCLANDVLQLQVTSSSGNTVYTNDLVVILQ